MLYLLIGGSVVKGSCGGVRRFAALLTSLALLAQFTWFTPPATAAAPTAPGPDDQSMVATPDRQAKPAQATKSPNAVEIVSRRSEHSKTYDNGDGTYYFESFIQRVNYLDPATNRYEPIDSSLKPSTRGSKPVFVNTADCVSYTLPQESSSGDWVSIDTPKGAVSFRPVASVQGHTRAGATAARGQLDESAKDKLKYRAAFGPTVDLEYISSSEGLKETIVLSRYTGVSAFDFEMITSGLTPVLQQDGSIWLLAPDAAEPALVMPAPYMEDSSEDEAGEPASSTAVRYCLTASASGWDLGVVADAEWLADPERVYPVRIDPTFDTHQDFGTHQGNGYYTHGDCFVSDAFPTTNYGASYDSGYGYQLKVGYYPTAGNNRTFIMPEIDDVLAWRDAMGGIQILGANMNLHCYWRYYHDSGDIWFAPIESSWGELSCVWNNQPTYYWQTLGTYERVTEGQRTRFDTTAWVQQWMNGQLPIQGFAFWGRGGQVADWTKFYASENSGIYPVFECWFATKPQKPVIELLPEGPVAGAQRVSWTYDYPVPEDEDARPQVRADIEIRVAGTTETRTGASNGDHTTGTVPTPSGGWVPGTRYEVRVQTVGGVLEHSVESPSDWSDWASFEYRPPTPPAAVASTTATWFAESDANADGLNDAMNDSNAAGRGAVTLTWQQMPEATGYKIYLSDGNAFRCVGEIPQQSQSQLTWGTSGRGLFPSDSVIAALAKDSANDPYVHNSTGLDLRDDPRPLYAKTAGTTYDSTAAYAFKVVPHYPNGDEPIDHMPVVLVSLEDRTDRLREDTAHAEYGMGDLFKHTGTVYLERGSLELDATDLAIDTYGPEAALSRHYSSSLATSSAFAPGWRFNFEQALAIDGDTAVFTDAAGDNHEFRCVHQPTAAATGGIKTTVGSNTIHRFTSSGTLSVTGTIQGASVLVVGGGGGGMTNLSGGGGGGGVVTASGQTLPATTTVAIGQGGGAYFSANGGNSSFGAITAYGGGRGASRDFAGQTAGTGGSGGGGAGAMASTEPNRAPGGGITGGGGGWGSPDWGIYSAGGGGGGAGGYGSGGGYAIGGMGGAGTPSAITGALAYYGGGGGGGSYFTPGAGRDGGGRGEGGTGSGGYGSTPGAANTGGGGGAGSPGGSGVVIVSYPTPAVVSTWIAPSGFEGTLTPDGSGYALTMADGSVLRFSSTGQLLSETDASGRAVTYSRTGTGVIITAANGHQIDVAISGGTVTGATYTAGGRTREVVYGGSSVTYFPGETDEYQIVYSYEGSKLTTLECPDFEFSGGGAVKWEFGYEAGTGRLQSWQLANTTQPVGANTIDYTETSADVRSPWKAGADAVETCTWNARGQLISRTPRTGTGIWRYVYGPTGECVFESTPVEHTVGRAFDSAGNLLAETEDATHTATWIYDSLNRVQTATDAGGSTTTYTYASMSASREPLTEQKMLGGEMTSVVYEYGSNDLMTKQTESITSTLTVETTYAGFASNGEPESTTVHDVVLGLDANGAQTIPQDLATTKSYDAFGNLTSEKNALEQWVIKENTYTVSGRLSSSKSASDAVTYYEYDRLGGVMGSRTTAGGETINRVSQVLDPLGTMLSKTSLDGSTEDTLAVEACFTDAAGRVVRVESRDGEGVALSVAHTDYDAAGRATTSWAPVAPDAVSDTPTMGVRTAYDAEGHVVSEQDAGADASTTTTYFPSGLVRQIDGADGSKTQYTYDAMGRQTTETKETVTNGATTSATTTSVYDIGGRLVRTIDETGDDTVFTYDRLGRQLSAGLEDIQDSVNVYNRAGWLLSETDSEGVSTRTAYDAAGRVLESTLIAQQESPKTTRSQYDTAGRLEKTTDPSGKVIEYGHDVFSRVELETQRVSDGGSTIKLIETDYDSLSRVRETTSTAGAAVVTRGYTYTGNVATEVAISYAGTTTTVEIDPGTSTERSRTVVADGVSTLVRAMTYDVANRETSATVDALSFLAVRGFDDASRLTAQSGTGITGEAAYTYQAGKKTSETIPLAGGTLHSTLGYSAESRLTTVTAAGTTDTFSYDLAGNLTRYVTGGVARVLSYEAGRLVNVKPEGGSVETTYTHDTLGRRTVRDKIGSSDDSVYFYNQASQMEAFGSSECSATYEYDATGQRYESVVTSGAVTTTTTFSYEGLTLLSLAASATGGDAWSLAYLYTGDGRPYAAVYSTETTTVPFSLLTTDRGDVVALLDSEGATFASYRYDQWGRPLATQTVATAKVGDLAPEIAERQVLRYAGYAWDAESSLYYCSARYYDPATMQFLTKDIAKADAEESPYQYCSGDPVGKVDPSGMWARVFKPKRFRDNWAYLLHVMKTNAGYAQSRLIKLVAQYGPEHGASLFCGWLYNMVRGGGLWDFKASWPGLEGEAAYQLGRRGRWVSIDDFGNMHYGFVFAASCVPYRVAIAGATLNGLRGGISSQKMWHELKNNYWITYGYALYLGHGYTVRPRSNYYHRGYGGYGR